MRKLVKFLILLSSGGLIYVLIELLYRGRSHWSMFLVVLEAKNLTERYQYKDGWNEYTVTERAFDMLQQKYSISQESLLD